MKLKFALVGLAALSSLAAAGTASAMPAATPNALGGSDSAIIQVRGGHGHGHMGGGGHHYGWGRGHGHHYGWRHHHHW
jgi:opacity protein-like surface antigen